MPNSSTKWLMGLFLGLVIVSTLPAQDSNILQPIAEIETKLRFEPFEVFRKQDVRFEGDIIKRMILQWEGFYYLQVKWKRAPKGGSDVNNEPRFEIAAYELQKLFLDPEEYVVPPTAARTLSVTEYREIESGQRATFKNSNSVVFVLSYWLDKVSDKKIYDKKRFERDSTYAKHFANMNILTHLIDHKDANVGNVLISTDPENPRVFAVDNSLAFSSPESNRGTEWRKLKVKRIPLKTVERLRQIRRLDLHMALGVVSEFEVRAWELEPVAFSENLDPKKGVRVTDKIVQFGLTQREVNHVYSRLEKLLEQVDSGKIKTF